MDNFDNEILIKETWTKEDYEVFTNYINQFKDDKYALFNERIINEDNIKLIGIRTPILRKLAKIISRGDVSSFFEVNPHLTYEDKIIHGFIINYMNISFDELITQLDLFIPYITNWAIADLVISKFKQFDDNLELGLSVVKRYLNSSNPWEIRVGILLLIAHYITDEYIEETLSLSNSIDNDNYYVKMANAWLISMCYIKHRNKTLNLIKSNKLDKWTHNKAIQKIRESLKVSSEEKEYLKTLKIT